MSRPLFILVPLLGASLTLNAVLLRRGHPAATSDSAPAPVTRTADPRPVAPVSPEVAASVGAMLSDSADPVTFRDLLIAAGIDAKLRRNLLETFVRHRYEPRFRALGPSDQSERLAAEWWKNPNDREFYTGPEARERLRAGQKLGEQFEAELAALEGRDPNTLDLADNPWLARQYSGLPPAKANALFRLQRDYDELEREVSFDSSDFQLPSDREKLRLLRAERERDIAALLTPEEREAWELRSSQTADRARYQATEFNATEAEFRQIYALQKAFDAQWERDNDLDPSSYENYDWDKRSKAQEDMENKIRALIGDERYAHAKREQNSDYTMLRAATLRLALPADTAGKIFDLRLPAATDSQRIAADPHLSIEDKKAALATLADHTRAQVIIALGQDAADAYFERGGMNWLKSLEQGATLKVRPDGVDTMPLSERANQNTSAIPIVPIN